MSPTTLADQVLPLIRTRTDLHRWSAANAHGTQMHSGVDLLEAAFAEGHEPREVYDVTHRALASALRVIARADDSSGIVGDACRRLLALHPQAAAAAGTPPAKLVDWMMTFQFDGVVDFFTLDPVAYAQALGEVGIAAYRERLADVESRLGQRPAPEERWSSPHAGEWFTLDWNAQRLAVLDRDVDAIIETHARDRRVAAWFEDTAAALEEIGEHDLAIDWAQRAVHFDRGHQALRAADRWCALLTEHRPEELLDARVAVFRRWPSSTSAARLHETAGGAWPAYRDEVMRTLEGRPRDAVLFAQLTLRDAELAWELAHRLGLDDGQVWSELVKEREKIDPAGVLPVLRDLAVSLLEVADARNYRQSAKHLARMRTVAQRAGGEHEAEVDRLVAQLREKHRRRPRLLKELDRVGLP